MLHLFPYAESRVVVSVSNGPPGECSVAKSPAYPQDAGRREEIKRSSFDGNLDHLPEPSRGLVLAFSCAAREIENVCTHVVAGED